MRVIISTHLYCSYNEHSGEQFGSWEESWDFSVTGARIAKDDENTRYNEDGFKVPDGTTEVHVLSMHYSEGDSFGRAEGKGIVVGCWADIEKAKMAEEELRKNMNEYMIETIDDFDRIIKISNPGAGYFDSVDLIQLETFIL